MTNAILLCLDILGGVAQLVEHLLCKQGVIGSNPFTSTKFGWNNAIRGLTKRKPPELNPRQLNHLALFTVYPCHKNSQSLPSNHHHLAVFWLT